jgi:methionyl aminopeptidase
MITQKSKEEIEILKEGGKILATILDELETLAIPGNTTLDIDDRAMELIEKYNVEPMILGYHPEFAARPYPAATCVSINDVLVHGIPNEDPIELIDGDIVSIDVVIGYKGMVVDSARTVGVGKVSTEVKQLIHIAKKALDAGIGAAKVGNKISDIGKAIEAVVPKGYGLVETFCGHGVGYSLHEDPIVPNFYIKGKSPELLPGMVLAIEPMITLGSKEVEILSDGYSAVTEDGSLAAHVEHTVAITEDGPLILTRSQKKS